MRKRYLLAFILFNFCSFSVSGQEIEWMKAVPYKTFPQYINDSIIVALSNYNFDNNNGVLYKFDTKSNLIKTITFTSNFSIGQEFLEQAFKTDDNKIIYSSGNIMVDADLNYTNNPKTGSFYSSSPWGVLKDSKWKNISIKDEKRVFSRFDAGNTLAKTDSIKFDNCFYGSGINRCVSFFNKERTFYFGFVHGPGTLYDAPSATFCSSSINKSIYIATNTVLGNFITYPSQLIASQQSIISFDTNGNIRLLRSFKGYPGSIGSDSKNNLVVLSQNNQPSDYNFYLTKYRQSTWDTVWSKKINYASLGKNAIFFDEKDNFYVGGNFVQKFDSSGNLIWTKLFSSTCSSFNPGVYNFSKNQNSIVIAGFSNGCSPVIMDCYTITSVAHYPNYFIAKIYDGTLPGTMKIKLKGVAAATEFPGTHTWWRNDTLLWGSQDSLLLFLKDGKYKAKAFCRTDTVSFKGIVRIGNTLQTVSVPGATYQWYLKDVTIPNSNHPSLTVSDTGNYKVSIQFNAATLSYGRTSLPSGSFTANYSYKITSSVVLEVGDNLYGQLFNISPNPATEFLDIQLTQFSQQEAEISSIQGQFLKRAKLEGEMTTIGIQELPSGVYLLKVGNLVRKWLKE